MSSSKPSSPLQDALRSLTDDLTHDEVRAAFDEVTSGNASDVQIAAFLFGLRVKGETTQEVAGIAASLLRSTPKIELPGNVLDIVGTGGDRTGMINISTPSSVLVASVGDDVTVVKHGNRGATTPTGSADVIEAWGIPLDLAPAQVAEVAGRVGITFCFAPRFHGAMRHAASARRALNVPTVMNILGPLTNPASPTHQLVGVADPHRMELLGRVIADRGVSAVLARGRDGLDKLTLTGPSDVIVVTDGRLTSLSIAPEDVGLQRCAAEALMGSTPADNADRLVRVLDGSEQGPVRDVVTLNAAAAAVLVEGAHDDFVERLKHKVVDCQRAIDSGAAIAKLRAWVTAASEVGNTAG